MLYIGPILPPNVDLFRCSQDVQSGTVDSRLDVLQAWVHLDVGHAELNFNFEKWPLQHHDPSTLLGAQAVFKRPEALLSGVEHGGVHEALIVRA